MRKIISIVVGVLVGLALIGYIIFYNVFPIVDEQYEETTVPSELENKVFNWKYNVGWNFRVEMTKNAIYWEGIEGDFEGMTAEVHSVYTQISDNIYFITWNVPFMGYDSLVLDLENDIVYAHSHANAKTIAIEGEVYCNGLHEECEAPHKNKKPTKSLL